MGVIRNCQERTGLGVKINNSVLFIIVSVDKVTEMACLDMVYFDKSIINIVKSGMNEGMPYFL